MSKTTISKKELESTTVEACLQNLLNQIESKYKDSFKNIVFVGILSAGFPLAERLAKLIFKEHKIKVPVGKLDVALYRDDLFSRGDFVTIRESDIPFSLEGKQLILIDDVLFHGRTIRAALNGLLDFGRPKEIELGVLVDRGFRELPIFANYIGATVVTNKEDHVKVSLLEIDGEDSISIQLNNS